MIVAACLKWTTPRDGDERYGGISAADRAALEWALRIGAAQGRPVLAVALGPVAAEGPLREALACGAERAVRIDAATTLDGADVAAALAAVLVGVTLVCCGDYSLDRGTGSVPAFLAAHLGARQALGLVDLEIRNNGVGDADPRGGDPRQHSLVAVRRLDGGRRERVRLAGGAPVVVSVEGGTATLRRAALSATLAARSRPIEVTAGPRAGPHPIAHEPSTRPYRPRARVLPPPSGASSLDRVKALLSSGVVPCAHGDPIVLDPPAAADRILAALTDWGYLP